MIYYAELLVCFGEAPLGPQPWTLKAQSDTEAIEEAKKLTKEFNDKKRREHDRHRYKLSKVYFKKDIKKYDNELWVDKTTKEEIQQGKLKPKKSQRGKG